MGGMGVSTPIIMLGAPRFSGKILKKCSDIPSPDARYISLMRQPKNAITPDKVYEKVFGRWEKWKVRIKVDDLQ
jgi:hypothetical protein